MTKGEYSGGAQTLAFGPTDLEFHHFGLAVASPEEAFLYRLHRR
jgi:hypothetical protein